MSQKPSVGRIVHYTSHDTADGAYDKECRAAIVTQVDDDDVGLWVFSPLGMFFCHAEHEELHDKIEPGPSGRTSGTWHWPEREAFTMQAGDVLRAGDDLYDFINQQARVRGRWNH